MIRWTEPANADFLGIIIWLQARNLAAAGRVGRRILDAILGLEDHSYIGKAGRLPDTRELVVRPFPCLVIYYVEAAADRPLVVILRILHGAMLWPPEDVVIN